MKSFFNIYFENYENKKAFLTCIIKEVCHKNKKILQCLYCVEHFMDK